MTTALEGVRVVDLSRVLAGPYAGQLLADHGAAVVKVEPPTGDETRTWGPPFREDGTAAYFVGLNRGKRNICVDLTSSAGREVVLALLAEADVLVENFKTGAMERWGLGPDELLARFPRLIYCRVTGYGTDGPLGGMPGYDAVLQATGGVMSVNGTADSGPMRVGIPIVDMATGLHAFSGVLLALYERERSGVGQVVEATLFDTALGLLHPPAATWFMTGQPPQRTGSAHSVIAPYQPFPTTDGAVFVAAGNDAQFGRLCETLGVPQLADDPRFRSNGDRVVHAKELAALIEAETGRWSRVDLAAALRTAGVPSGPLLGVGEALSLDHARVREMIVEIDDYRGLGAPVKLSRTPARPHTPPRRRGQDNADVLAELGLDETEPMRGISEADVIGRPPVAPPAAHTETTTEAISP